MPAKPLQKLDASKIIAEIGMPANPLQTLDASKNIAGIGMVVQVACSMAGAVPGPGAAEGLHLPQAHFLPPLQAVVLGKLR